MAVPRSRAVRRWKRRWQAKPSSGENGDGRQGSPSGENGGGRQGSPSGENGDGRQGSPLEKTAVAGKVARPESYISGTDQENAG